MGVAILSNASDSHPFKPHFPNVAPASEMTSNSLSLQQGLLGMEVLKNSVDKWIPWLNPCRNLLLVLKGSPRSRTTPHTKSSGLGWARPGPSLKQAKAASGQAKARPKHHYLLHTLTIFVSPVVSQCTKGVNQHYIYRLVRSDKSQAAAISVICGQTY